MRTIFAAASLLALAACGFNGTDRYAEDGSADREANATTESLADSMASHDGGDAASDIPNIPDTEARPIMQAQVVLDRQGFGPGVIDGKMGMSTTNALRGFQEAHSLSVTGELDEPTKAKLAQWQSIPATRVVRIPADWGTLKYARIPEDAADQAKMERLGYENLDEKLAERFHTTVDVLKALNPGGRPAGMTEGSMQSPVRQGTGPATPGASPSASGSPADRATASPSPTPSASGTEGANTAPLPSTFAAGQLIRVPNIGGDRIAPGAVDDPDWQQTLQSLGVGTEQPNVERIVVSKSKGTLKGYDQAGKLLVLFTVTSGSSKDPLPLGNWKINGVARNPTFAYNPELFWDVPDHEEKQQLPPGPNGPVGVVWIDLDKEHYGIHGTPEPQTIGRAQSHGCVRLTNWDAARLAQMVKPGTKVVFEA
ncbi:L,D-transpeptidase family protein [Altererythrobacter aerius]|uniref:L,D-transpeptidase family protein n=1 Tax=Tsuneonella aeria TaxID=1837929 RepID=A0A6I4T8S5_9SPHN|nr:L,D-transpeptidase family protein [Tsuneonella aeria]MXO73959.1 L,D-transpeptidase family protein [Tsuneonella aeria]